jgi:hypothetical protein
MTVCFVVGAAKASWAQDKVYDFEGFNKMQGTAVSSLFSGRTFWGKKQYDRFYFGKDGSFAQQYVKAGQDFKPGSTFYGTWNVDNDGAVCVTYQQSNVASKPADECFDVYMGPDKFKPLPKYTDPIYMVKKGDTSKTTATYFWSRWMEGRLILDPTFAAQFEKQLDFMQSYKSKFDANRFSTTPPVKDVNALPEGSQNYLKTIAGKVLYTPYHFLYFGANGDYIFYDRGDFNSLKGDMAKLKGTADKGRWVLHNNVHCWSKFGDKPATTCQMVSQGGTLDKPAQSFVTHVDDGFTRLLDGNPVGIMSVEETGAPAAFQ